MIASILQDRPTEMFRPAVGAAVGAILGRWFARQNARDTNPMWFMAAGAALGSWVAYP